MGLMGILVQVVALEVVLGGVVVVLMVMEEIIMVMLVIPVQLAQVG